MLSGVLWDLSPKEDGFEMPCKDCDLGVEAVGNCAESRDDYVTFVQEAGVGAESCGPVAELYWLWRDVGLGGTTEYGVLVLALRSWRFRSLSPDMAPA